MVKHELLLKMGDVHCEGFCIQEVKARIIGTERERGGF